MPTMTDRAIQSWIRKGERFEGRADGGGLYLSYRENFKTPVWRFRYQLAALGIAPHVAERCLNHKLKGMEGVYDAHDYFEERRDALNQWAALLGALERGEDWNVTPLRQAGRHMQAVDKEP